MLDNAEQVAESRRKTYLEKYGVEHPVVSDEHRRELSARMSDGEHQRRLIEARRAKGTLATSAPEDSLHAMLLERFGTVERQYRDEERYPFACDFYVPERDLFIELNGSWTHGRRWYDPDSTVDQQTVAAWQAKNTEYYRQAEYAWTDLDVRKRAAARAHDLNLVVLWDGSQSLADARLWLALGAPDGRDWEREYSWLPERELSLDGSWPTALDGRPRISTAAARAANWRTFYARELAAWQADEVSPRRWGRTRVRLLANRLQYLGKVPAELSDLEVLRGFGISGALRAYTVFDNTGMVEVLRCFSPRRVYDPCAGWGERMATCAALGIEYLGVDVNEAVVAGHARMAEQYSLTEQCTVFADSGAYDAAGFDAEFVFTCPPYGDIEVYTAAGAENLDEAGFLQWWGRVADNAVGPSTQVFAFQVNQKWRDVMVGVLEARGWALTDRIDVGRGAASHFNRTADGASSKREFEQIQVLQR